MGILAQLLQHSRLWRGSATCCPVQTNLSLASNHLTAAKPRQFSKPLTWTKLSLVLGADWLFQQETVVIIAIAASLLVKQKINKFIKVVNDGENTIPLSGERNNISSSSRTSIMLEQGGRNGS